MRRGAWRTLAVALGVGAVAATGMWALAPLETPDLSIPATTSAAEAATEPEPIPALDLAAFRAPLWIAPPPPPPPPAPAVAAKEPEPPPPPPLKLQLLAIVREEDGTYRALVYDPDQDTLLALTEGQSVGPRTVESVTADEVTFRDRRGVRALALRDDGSVAAGGGRR